MPAKVNPVIPEVVNQTVFKVFGNDLTVSMASEAGQLQLNVMEPAMGEALFQSVRILGNAVDALREVRRRDHGKRGCLPGVRRKFHRYRHLFESTHRPPPR